jgi:hypothetical protein
MVADLLQRALRHADRGLRHVDALAFSASEMSTFVTEPKSFPSTPAFCVI